MKREEQKKLFQKWFIWAISISFFLSVIYVGLHMCISGSEIRMLSSEQLSTINTLIVKHDEAQDAETKDALVISIKNFMKTSLMTTFNSDSIASANIDELIGSRPPKYLSIVLPTYTFEVKSFFWLKGRKVYAELLFWVWFGVISSVLHKAILEYNKGCFSKKLIYDHIAKFFYAPFVALALYLCSDLLSSQKLIALDKISYGAIVFVFILGFFSWRAIELLNRVKDVIIPANAAENENLDNAQRFDIEGTVVDASGLTGIDLKGCVVSLKHTEQPSVNFSTKVEEGNSFSFDEVPEGLYQIEAELKTTSDNKEVILSATKGLFIEKNALSNIINVELSLKPRF